MTPLATIFGILFSRFPLRFRLKTRLPKPLSGARILLSCSCFDATVPLNCLVPLNVPLMAISPAEQLISPLVFSRLCVAFSSPLNRMNSAFSIKGAAPESLFLISSGKSWITSFLMSSESAEACSPRFCLFLTLYKSRRVCRSTSSFLVNRWMWSKNTCSRTHSPYRFRWSGSYIPLRPGTKQARS